MHNKKTTTILIADDEVDMRSLLTSILRSCGYSNIVHAVDGLKAIDVISASDIDIAFLDIDMPGMTGIEVLKTLNSANTRCFSVIVSAHSALDNVKGALDAGARGFVVKPYSARKILDLLARFEKEAVGS